MAKQTFNEAELFLIQNWDEAQALADTMAKARKKNQELLEKIVEAVLVEYQKDFDFGGIKTGGEYCCLTFSRKGWPRDGNRPAGLYLDFLGLDSLASKEVAEIPEAYVYMGPARKKTGLDVASAKQKLWQELPKWLTPEEQQPCLKYEDNRDAFVGWYFSSKQEILGWITAGDEQKLKECIQDQVAIFVKLLPVLNDLLRSDKGKNPSGPGVSPVDGG